MRTLIFSVFGLLFLGFFSCKKFDEGCIKGNVTDIQTGKPVEGVLIYLQGNYVERGSLRSWGTTVKTDSLGNFDEYIGQGDPQGIWIFDIYKKGYSSKFKSKGRENETCKDLEIQLTPLDGLVKLQIQNETGSQDSIFFSLFPKCSYKAWGQHDRYATPFPLALPKGETHNKIYSACIGDSIAIHWKYSKIGSYTKKDTFVVNSPDTVFYTLKY